MRPLDREQVRVLFETARDDRFVALYVLAVAAGLRRGELQGLKWEDVDLEAGTPSLKAIDERMRCGDLWQDHGLVFSSGVGTPVLRGDLNRAKALL